MKKKKNSDDGDVKTSDNMGRKIILSIITLLVVLAVAIVIAGHHYVKTALKPLNNKNDDQIEVNIPMGASNRRIGSILQNDHVIKSGIVFDYYVSSHNINNFRSGYYQLSPSMTLDQIAQKLKLGGSNQSFKSLQNKVLVREGADINMIASMVDQRTDFSREQFLLTLKNKAFINSLVKRYPQLLTSASRTKQTRYILEGYLAPATYDASKKTLKELITEMVDNTDRELKPYYNRIKKEGLTVHQMLTLASLVEKEPASFKDRSIIVGILINRLNNNLPLNSVASLCYGLQTTNTNFTKKQYRAKTPYNLFSNLGTGAGPIDSPSFDSVKAALYPSQQSNGYLYYLYSAKNNKLYYSQNYIVH